MLIFEDGLHENWEEGAKSIWEDMYSSSLQNQQPFSLLRLNGDINQVNHDNNHIYFDESEINGTISQSLLAL